MDDASPLVAGKVRVDDDLHDDRVQKLRAVQDDAQGARRKTTHFTAP